MVSVSTLLALGLVAPASAVPVGDPVPLPEAGRVRLDTRVGTHSVAEKDTRCQGSTGCSARWRQTSVVGGLHLAVLKGVGVFGEVGLAEDRIRAADYRGRAQTWAAGIRTAVPLGPSLWLAANARMDRGEGVSLHADEEPDPETAEFRIYSGTLLGVWGDGAEGVSVWAGGQSSWHWEHHVWPLGTSKDGVHLDVPLSPEWPVSGVVGFGVTSDPVGLPWRTSSRLTVALEGRVGQEVGVTGWIGVAL